MSGRLCGNSRFSLRAFLVLASSLACVTAAMLVIGRLESRAVAARDAQSSLLAIRLDLMQIRDIPWDASPGSGTSPADTRAELQDALGSLRASLAKLDRGPGLPERMRINHHVELATASLWKLFAAVKRGDSEAADAASDPAARHMYAADAAMKKAAAEYRARSADALREARIDSVVVILMLFAAFAWFYAGAVRRRRRAELLAAENRRLLLESRVVVDALRRTEEERSRLFEQVVEAAEEERVRVAAELHDGPIQQLTALALMLDLAARRVDASDAASVSAVLARVRNHVAEQMRALRTLMAELRPPGLDEIGLEAALSDYVAGFDRKIDAHCEFHAAAGDIRLGAALETTLYRVAQEALANVAKHAHAHTVRVSLAREDGAIRLRVEDDGVGFVARAQSELINDGHFGLVGMRERIERAGGEWRIESLPGEGTVVEAVVPVAPSDVPARGPGLVTATLGS